MPPPAKALEPLAFEQIEGWREDDLSEALEPFRRSCAVLFGEGRFFDRQVRYGGEPEHWRAACEAAGRETDAQRLFETHFRPFRVIDPQRPAGLFTGYYEPESEGRRQRSEDFAFPLYARPPDLVAFDDLQKQRSGLDYGRLVDGAPRAFLTRKEIESGALAGRGLEIVWLRDAADAFFMQVQGSGRIRHEDGSIMRLGFAAKSGLPYTSIGAILADRGLIAREKLSMQAIRHWMTANAAEARDLMWQNESFVFFREIKGGDEREGPVGAGLVPLMPQRSIAIDRSLWMFGTPVWLATEVPKRNQPAPAPFRKLLIAQDTGSAIRGMVRGDVFWGAGEEAAYTAGHMKSPGQMIVLLPRKLASSMGFKP